MSFFDGLNGADMTHTIAYGGETNDTQTETLDGFVGTVSVSPSTDFAQTGTYSLKFDLTTNGNKAVLIGSKVTFLNGATAGIQVFAFAAALSAAPSSELGLITGAVSNNSPAQPSARSYVRIGTDRKIYLYDKNGIAIPGGVSTSLVPTSGAMKEFVISYDSLSIGTTFIKLYADGVEELAFNTGVTLSSIFSTPDFFFYGEYLGASVNRGCSLYLDDMYSPYSTSSSDALHLLAYPRVRVANTGLPDASATDSEWTVVGGASQVDCVNTNDGDTKHLGASASNKRSNFKSSAANPLPNPCNVIKWQLRQVGLKTASGKALPRLWLGRPVGSGGTSTYDQGAGFPGAVTTYTAQIIPNPTSGLSLALQRSDADPNVTEWGCLTASAGGISDSVTFCPGPEWVYYTSTLPLGTSPLGSAPVNTSVVGTGTGATIA